MSREWCKCSLVSNQMLWSSQGVEWSQSMLISLSLMVVTFWKSMLLILALEFLMKTKKNCSSFLDSFKVPLMLTKVALVSDLLYQKRLSESMMERSVSYLPPKKAPFSLLSSNWIKPKNSNKIKIYSLSSQVRTI